MRLAPALTALAATLLVGCGALNGGGAIPTPTPIGPPTDALAGWAAFPADQTPRPVVMILNASPPGGFTNNEGKLAMLCNKFTLGIVLPRVAPAEATVTWATGATGTYPSITAADALTAMKRQGFAASDPNCVTARPLLLTGARVARSEYITDRGTAQIDSWRFSLQGMTGELSYPALAPPAIWNADMRKGVPDRGSVVSPDGLTLTFSFYGAPATSGPCGADYRGVVAESQAAVAIALQEISHAKPGENVACDLMAQLRSVTVKLASALGGRVVVDQAGKATSVCPSTKPDC